MQGVAGDRELEAQKLRHTTSITSSPLHNQDIKMLKVTMCSDAFLIHRLVKKEVAAIPLPVQTQERNSLQQIELTSAATANSPEILATTKIQYAPPSGRACSIACWFHCPSLQL
jgi:hypothetical protein